MKHCSEDLINLIFRELITAPDSDISEEVRELLMKFRGGLVEKYDLLVRISKFDTTQVSDFVKSLCALDEYYFRPDLD